MFLVILNQFCNLSPWVYIGVFATENRLNPNVDGAIFINKTQKGYL